MSTSVPSNWLGKPYYSLDAFCKNTYHEKLFKIALDAGFTCPNRDGTLGTEGCIFCSAGGSGDFATPLQKLSSQIEPGKKYIAYFQAYTNTYASVSYLEQVYTAAISEPQVLGISIATRPDCLPSSVIDLLMHLKMQYPEKFIWVELGLQTIHEQTAAFIRRGYPLSVFTQSVSHLFRAGIPVIVHVILGLPGETGKDILETIAYLNENPIWGIKLQLLHILENTGLGTLYKKDSSLCGSYATMEEYLEILTECVTHLRPDFVIHRLTGDAPRKDLLFPKWSSDKRRVLNSLHRLMKEEGSYQGKYY